MNRQPIDIGIDGAIPEHRIIVDLKAVDHPDARAGAIGHVEPAGRRAGGDAPDVVHVANGLDGLNKAMLGANIVNRYGTSYGRRLIDCVEEAPGAKFVRGKHRVLRRRAAR